MRILGIGPRAYLGDIYMALTREGHDVRVCCEDSPETHAFAGLLSPIADWRAELPWVGRDGVILFERADHGADADALRRAGFRVVGGSAVGDRLENDRAFGQAALAQAGLPVAGSRGFAGPAEALAFLERHPGRHVLKYDGQTRPTFVGDHPRGDDVAFMLRRAVADPTTAAAAVLLMERLDGVEIGVGAYCDGKRFLRPVNLDFEHKRFFPGELGEMTGEMGTLASFAGAERLFDATLGRLESVFAAAGHVGYVNLNLIVDSRGAWPLEFTCRLGNPGFAVLAALQRDGWGDLFHRMTTGDGAGFATLPGWSVAIVLTVPPFPATLTCTPEDDPPLFFLDQPGAEDIPHYRCVDMRRDAAGQLLVHRRSGHAMIVTGTGDSVPDAQAAARARARNVVVPEIRWRADIGDRFMTSDAARLRAWGWLD